MAAELVVRIIGDTKELEKSYARASKATKGFDRDVKNASRGVFAATASFAGLRRAVLSTSASFIGGVSVVAGIKSTIQAAEESQRVLAQTQNAVEQAGLSWGEYGKRVQDAALAQSKLSGFDDVQLLQTFSNLVRSTRNVNEALRLNALAANVARGRNIDLESAQQIVLKASIGQVGALRRLGIALDKNATSAQALDALNRRYANSAAAYGRTAAGAQDRFRVAVQNLQEAIGAGLLPKMTVYLNKASAWLNNSKNQERVTRDLTGLITALGDAAYYASRGLDALLKAYDNYQSAASHLPGGNNGFLQILVKGTLGRQIDAFTSKVEHLRQITGDKGLLHLIFDGKGNKDSGDFFTTFKLNLEAAVGEAQRAVAEAAAAANAPTASSVARSTGADRASRAAKPPKPLTAEQRNTFFDNALARSLDRVQDIPTIRGQIARLKEIGALIQKRIDATKDVTRKLTLEDQLVSVQRTVRADEGDLAEKAARQEKAAAEAAQRALESRIRTRLVNLRSAVDAAKKGTEGRRRAQQDLVAALRAEAHDEHLTAAARAQYNAALVRELNREAADDAATAKKAKQTAAARLESFNDLRATMLKAHNAAEKARATAQETAQFRALGLGPGGSALVPNAKTLRRQLGNVADAIKGTFFDTSKTRSVLEGVRRVLSGALGDVKKDVRSTVKGILDDLDKQLQDHAGDQTKFRHQSTSKILAAFGLNLTPAESRRVRSVLAQIGPGGTVPGARSAAFAGASSRRPLQVNMIVNGQTAATAIVPFSEQQMERRQRARASTRRGH